MTTVRVTTPPAALALSLVNAKDHLRVDHSDEDTLITALVTAATEYLERVYDKAFVDQSIEVTMADFPADNEVIKLPRGPIDAGSISVSYTDTDGNPQTFTLFQVDANSTPPRIAPDPDECWPDVQCDLLVGVTITYDAGLGADDTAVPERYQQALKLLVGHWYGNRESVITGTISTEVQQTLDMLMWHDRLFDFAKAG